MKLSPPLILFLLLLGACQVHRLPKEQFSQYSIVASSSKSDHELRLSLGNPLACPLRVYLSSSSPELQTQSASFQPLLLPPHKDTLLIFEIDPATTPDLQLHSALGDPRQKVLPGPVELPFPKGKSYPIIQAHNSGPTHNTDFSRYAIDFGLARGDTVCAATDGFVVGVIEGYKHGGEGTEWRPYSNYITLYDPASGLFTQYVHLRYQGSLVRVGDEVKGGHPIGLSGKTGQTNIQHLHFNCLVPVADSSALRSVPIDFAEGYRGSQLERGKLVIKK